MLNRRSALMGALSLCAAPAFAQDPGALPVVRGFYARGFDERKMPMSRKLRRLFLAADARSKRDDEPVAGLDFSWIIGAQDADDGWQRTLAFKPLAQTVGNAVVEVRFRSGGPQIILFRMIREADRWVVDDIEYPAVKEKLSTLLELGAKGET